VHGKLKVMHYDENGHGLFSWCYTGTLLGGQESQEMTESSWSAGQDINLGLPK
jgi:hypothetical protein